MIKNSIKKSSVAALVIIGIIIYFLIFNFKNTSPEFKKKRFGNIAAWVTNSSFQLTAKTNLAVLVAGTENKSKTLEIKKNGESEQIQFDQPYKWKIIRLKIKKGTNISFSPQAEVYVSKSIFVRKDNATQKALISLDTLRYDTFLQCPGLKGLMKNGLFMENAFSSSSWTAPSHMSVFTGKYPYQHGVIHNTSKLPHDIETLGEHMHNKGVIPIAVTNGGFVGYEFGFSRGFLLYIEVPNVMFLGKTLKLDKKLRILKDSIQTSKMLLQEINKLPVFFFYHTFHPHSPYIPVKPPKKGKVSKGVKGTTSFILSVMAGKKSPNHSDLNYLKSLYTAQVLEMDPIITSFVKELIDKKFEVVIFSDHGEEFGEHGLVGHGTGLYSETTHVPVLIISPEIQTGKNSRLFSICHLFNFFSQGKLIFEETILSENSNTIWANILKCPDLYQLGLFSKKMRLHYSNCGQNKGYEKYKDLDDLVSAELSENDILKIHNHISLKNNLPEKKDNNIVLSPKKLKELKSLGYVK